MAVKIVTDSASDIPVEIASELGITVVPCNVHFGTETYRDGVDLMVDEFYEKLVESPVHPTTSQPSPGAFVDVFDSLADDADGIVAIHISSKLSGTYNSAVQASGLSSTKCPIEVVDSYQVSMGMGLVVMAAAEAAQQGATMDEILTTVKSLLPKAEVFCLLNTLEYLRKGGRIGAAKAMVGTMLNIKPIITIRDGVVEQIDKVRSTVKGENKLLEIAKSFDPIESASVFHSTSPEAADRISQKLFEILPESKSPVRANLGTAIGVHSGPGALCIALICKS